MIRIANGQGFWGDSLDAPVHLVEQGPIDYLALDYLAEITHVDRRSSGRPIPISGMRAIFCRSSSAGCDRIRERGITVIANAGGVNPLACAREVVRVAPGLKVAVVLGDDGRLRAHRRVSGEGL